MRLFYALPLPPGFTRALGRVGADMKRRFPGLSVPREAGLHFTIFFFGEVDAEGAARLSGLLDAEELGRPAVRVRFSAVETFPPTGNPRVVYAAVDEGAEGIVAVHDCLGRLLARERWPVEDEHRPFRPHVTIARNKRDFLSREALDGIVLPAEPFTIDRCVLFRSDLRPDGAVYTPIKERRFGT
ncbi:MAG: RNA 2',3'-cyclic phosphodiesterase [Spirochaetales bacterium]|nr:RNA 2',3'-cyclic phosphodiesterase [Spirochaetales bacterium]